MEHYCHGCAGMVAPELCPVHDAPADEPEKEPGDEKETDAAEEQ